MTLGDGDLQEMGITNKTDRDKLLLIIARLNTKSEVRTCGCSYSLVLVHSAGLVGGLGKNVF